LQDAALAIVVTPQDTVLLVQRRDVPVWVLPGGGIEAKESPELAAIRETFEESGIAVDVIDHVATYFPRNKLSATTHLFLCKPIGSIETKIQDSEISAAQFFSPSELPSTLFPLHQTFIHEWKSASMIPIVRVLTEVSYLALIRLFLSHPWWTIRYLWTRCLNKMT
jgi:8-oxo-dGTP pyrophosphatase MutT (NUDIX family)